MTLSLRDAAFALDPAATGTWSLRRSLEDAMFPPLPDGPISLLGDRKSVV